MKFIVCTGVSTPSLKNTPPSSFLPNLHLNQQTVKPPPPFRQSLKVTKFLGKISQFEFKVMTEVIMTKVNLYH